VRYAACRHAATVPGRNSRSANETSPFACLPAATGAKLERDVVLDKSGYHRRVTQQCGGHREVDLLLQHSLEGGRPFGFPVGVGEYDSAVRTQSCFDVLAASAGE
jgi:hypothetical protein